MRHFLLCKNRWVGYVKRSISNDGLSKIINNLDTLKTTQQDDITTKTNKDNKDLSPYFISASLTILRIRAFFQTN